MARLESAALVWLAAALALAAWAPAGSAGSADAPEITDPAGDQVFVIVPTGSPIDQFTSADLVAAWIGETAADLLISIQVAGTGTTSTTTEYSYEVHLTVDGTDTPASATSTADQPTPGGAATAASLDGSVVTLTVPKEAIGATTGTGITAIWVEANGNFVDTGVLAATDTAPDDGADAGITYTVTGGSGGGNGTAGDSDGDGLNDTKETDYFGNVTKENGTGDPDADGLNNTAEFDLGTDPTDADTDGDGLDDKADGFPLDPRRPNSRDPGGNTTDSDGDGLPDGYEREHFGGLNQTGAGDPDADGLNTTEERDLGTDPTKADTDGDGALDGNDSAPLDPAVSENQAESDIEPELYAGAPMFAAIATLCLIALGRIS